MSLLLAARRLYTMDYLKIIVFFIFLLESCNARQQGYNAVALPYKYVWIGDNQGDQSAVQGVPEINPLKVIIAWP
jgi:hypothetical protein